VNKPGRVDHLSDLTEAVRRLTNSLRILSAAIEKFDIPKPVNEDPTLTRLLCRLTRRFDTPVANYLRRF
jgi:hypothetical protein